MHYLKKIKIFSKAFFLAIKEGPGSLKTDQGRIIHFKTEYLIKVNAILTARNIFKKNKKYNKYQYSNHQKYLSIKNYLIWQIQMLTFEFIHFCVLVDHRYKAIYKKEYKRYPGPKSIYKKLRILNFLVLLYLPPKLIFLNLLSIKSIALVFYCCKFKFYLLLHFLSNLHNIWQGCSTDQLGKTCQPEF